MTYRFAYVDPSAATYVSACRSCPHWSSIHLTESAAYASKADHDQRVHAVEPARAAAAGKLFQERSGVSSDLS